MLIDWLVFTVVLAGAATGQGSVTVAPTCRVKGHLELELTLNCGDGKNAGVVQYWHTPFGELHSPGFHSKLNPVFMHHDGSLVVPNSSALHSGLYYCILQHTEGNTLWPYELRVDHNHQNNQEDVEYEQDSCHDALRVNREAGYEEEEEEEQAAISDGQFAGAVAASVLLTFVAGFSAGALASAHILRCLGAVTKRLRSPQQEQYQTDPPEHGSEVTVPAMYDNHAFEMGHVQDEHSVNSSSPPAKPQRSFRHKRAEQLETTVYLEGCDYMKEEEAGTSLEQKKKGCDGEEEEEEEEEREFSDFYLLGEDGGSQPETGKCSGDKEDRGRRESREEVKEWRQDEKEESEQQDGEERRGSEEETPGNKEEDEEEGRGEEKERGGDKREEDVCRDSQSSTEQEGSETDSQRQTSITGTERQAPSSPPCPARRVIRLYQYNEDGQRYCHLPAPSPDDPGPAPRQRTVSLTRLNTIMASASAVPLDQSGTVKKEKKERPHFHMEL